MSVVLLSLFLFAAGGDKRVLDVVELKDGTRIDGRVVYEDPSTVVVRSAARDREIAMKDVSLVRSRATELRAVLDSWNKETPTDTAGMLELARSSDKADLVDEAQVFTWRALLLDPKNEEAHKRLGHTSHNGVWTVHEGTKSIPFASIGDAHKDWKDPWSFATTHYRLQTNLDLGRATDMALDLEGFYRIFFDAFGRELRLYEVVDPMVAQVHADKQSFPGVVSYRDAYFDPTTSTLLVNAANGFEPRVLFHEATHEILFNTAERTKGSRGDIPAWLDEGLAEYMGCSMSGLAGHPVFTSGAVATGHFRVHAEARTPYDLARVLTFNSGDFMASSRSDLKYAEAYTLVHFLLNGDGGKHKKGFLDFVRSAYKGQSSSTHFRDALGGHERELEEAWVAYVKKTAADGAPAKASPRH
jgi:Protein of unknown function (DUF1570)